MRGHQIGGAGLDRGVHVGDRPDGTGTDGHIRPEAGTGAADRGERPGRVQRDLQAPDPGLDEHVEYRVQVLRAPAAQDRHDPTGEGLPHCYLP